jgi:hypothetical protein
MRNALDNPYKARLQSNGRYAVVDTLSNTVVTAANMSRHDARCAAFCLYRKALKGV